MAPFPILRPIPNSALASSIAKRSLQGNLQLANSIYLFSLSMELLDHHQHHHEQQQQQQCLTSWPCCRPSMKTLDKKISVSSDQLDTLTTEQVEYLTIFAPPNNQNQTNHCNLIQRADKFAQLKAGLAIQSRASYRLTTSSSSLSGTAQWSPTSSSSLISIIQVPSSSWVWGRSEWWRRDLQVQGNELQQEWVLLWSQQPGARQVERYIWVWFTQIQISFPFQSLFVAKSHQVGEGRLATMGLFKEINCVKCLIIYLLQGTTRRPTEARGEGRGREEERKAPSYGDEMMMTMVVMIPIIVILIHDGDDSCTLLKIATFRGEKNSLPDVPWGWRTVLTVSKLNKNLCKVNHI